MLAMHQGRVADAVLLVMLIEYVVLGLVGRGWGATMVALLPGGLLVLALRAAAPMDVPSPSLLLMVALALPAHLLDLKRRGWM